MKRRKGCHRKSEKSTKNRRRNYLVCPISKFLRVTRLSLLPLKGRQIFERGTNVDEDDTAEEGVVSVDISQYDRRATRDDEDDDEGDRVHFSDNDSD